MNTLTELMERNKGTILLDGSTGVLLMDAGLPEGKNPPVWNLERSDKVLEVADSYFAAGSDGVLTNSFTGSVTELEKHGLADMAYIVNITAARLATAVRPAGKFVLGSMGPTGLGLAYAIGDATDKHIIGAYTPQIMGLVDGGVEGFILETFDVLGELLVAIKAVREYSALPIIASMVFCPGARGYRSMDGTSIPEAAEALTKENLAGIGSNCGYGLDFMIDIAREFRAYDKNLPLLAKSNAGRPRGEDGRTVYSETPDFWRERIPALLEYNPRFIGGCCGTYPAHISVIRDLLGR